MDAETIAEWLFDLEREWITGWQGPKGAAFNAIANSLYLKGLLVSRTDWSLNSVGLEVRAILEKN